MQYRWTFISYDTKLKFIRVCFLWILYKPFIYVLHILYKFSECVIYTTGIKAIVISKKKDFAFCWEKEKIIDKNIKSKGPSIEPSRTPFTIFVQSLNVDPILILRVRFVRQLKNSFLLSLLKSWASRLGNNWSSFRQSWAFDKSIRIEPTNPTIFNKFFQEVNNSLNKACYVPCAFLNQHKISLKIGSK